MSATMQVSRILDTLRLGHDAGICLIPPREDGTKRPDGEWQTFQSRRPTAAEMHAMFIDRPRTGIGAVCGAVSGNLECLEFDDADTVAAFLGAAGASGLGELVNQIRNGYEESTPGGGIHWLYRCPDVAGNTKLARRPGPLDEHGRPTTEVLIETRGEGGYVIIAPSNGSVHPTGGRYALQRGGIDTIAFITLDEASELKQLACSFDQMPVQEYQPSADRISRDPDGLRPGDDFNQRADWAEVLEPAGWTFVYQRGEESFWRRPGKDIGISATTNFADSDLFICFSTSVSFEPEAGYSKWRTYANLFHAGDFAAAARDLKQQGYGGEYGGSFTIPPTGAPASDDGEADSTAEDESDTADEHDSGGWRSIVDDRQLLVAELPHHLRLLVEHISPFTPMFPVDWPIMMALPFWSTLWPSVRIQNLSLTLWTLGISLQGIGKNVATDELQRVVSSIDGADLRLYTAGTPEGIWEALAGENQRMLAYLDEFGGFMKLLRRDYMSGAREALSSLYDGRAIGYHRTKKTGVSVTDPYFVMVATTQAASIRQFGEPQDLQNGYLSRFMICAPDVVAKPPDFYPEDGPRRSDLVRKLREGIQPLQGVRVVQWLETGRPDPPLLNEYREHLGMGTGELLDLDDPSNDATIPAGRLVARAKKIAALLELAEELPHLSDDKRTVSIRPENLVLAITIVEHGYAYATRLQSWIAPTSDFELSRTVVRILKQRRKPMTKRELCRITHAKATDIQTALDLNQQAGLIVPEKQGRELVWKVV